VSAHDSASDRNSAFASTMRLTMPNRSKVLRASRSIRVTVTTSPGGQLVELHVKRLAVGVGAGITDEAFFGASFGHILRKT
jgi:hypothetical protein